MTSKTEIHMRETNGKMLRVKAWTQLYIYLLTSHAHLPLLSTSSTQYITICGIFVPSLCVSWASRTPNTPCFFLDITLFRTLSCLWKRILTSSSILSIFNGIFSDCCPNLALSNCFGENRTIIYVIFSKNMQFYIVQRVSANSSDLFELFVTIEILVWAKHNCKIHECLIHTFFKDIL